MSHPILSCEHLTKSFRHTLIPVRHLQERIAFPLRRKKWWVRTVVDNVSFDLQKGEWVGVYGPNGCGKTTLMRMLAGLLPPDAGTVACRADISCFFELSIGFHEERTAEENVRMHAMLQGLPPKGVAEILGHVREFAGIHEHWDLPLKCYSVGQRLRLGFAVTTASPADVLLLDEILAVGDADFQKRCRQRLKDLKHSGRSALIVSHSLADLEAMCDRVLFMEKGCVVREETAAVA
ncbi:MAG: ABC transporter ATP-binding protein [Patescibacteria group bacterium]